MISDINIYGVLVPTLLPLAMASYLVFRLTHRALATVGIYRHVWHPALFDIALYFVLLGLGVGLFERVTS
jgi:hypothetical protein